MCMVGVVRQHIYVPVWKTQSMYIGRDVPMNNGCKYTCMDVCVGVCMEYGFVEPLDKFHAYNVIYVQVSLCI